MSNHRGAKAGKRRNKGRRRRDNSWIDRAKNSFLDGIGPPEPSPFKPDDFQIEAVNSVINGEDTLVVAPTGAGKTYIALQAIDATLGQGARAIYTTPLKALSNTKYAELKKRFEPQHKVGLLTGDRKIDGDASVVIATTEIFRNELYHTPENYSLVVLDEVHFIGDPQRGPVWEESIILAPSSATLLMLSASISNAEEIAEWLKEVRGRACRIVTCEERPVELRLGFLHPDHGPLPLRKENGEILSEVSRYYGSTDLDKSGMRLKGGKFQRPRGRRKDQGSYKGKRRNNRRNRQD